MSAPSANNATAKSRRPRRGREVNARLDARAPACLVVFFAMLRALLGFAVVFDFGKLRRGGSSSARGAASTSSPIRLVTFTGGCLQSAPSPIRRRQSVRVDALGGALESE